MNLISENLRDALCTQLSLEKYNSNFYLSIAGFLKNKGLDNIAKLFLEQHEEEFNHSKLFFDILVDLNAEVKLMEVDEITDKFNSIKELALAYLNREISTTESLEEIKQLAIEEKNSVVEEFIRDMIKIQRKEYEEATSFLDKSELLSEWWQVALWDVSIG